MSNTVIKVENLSKQYRLGDVGTGSLKDDFKRFQYRLMGKDDPFLTIGEENNRTTTSKSDYVWALKDFNFEVQQGDVLGIIGSNGAGKSTLLKILSRTTGPTTGTVKMKGRIASLLEVGTGFHGELSGRENIYLNGAIMGLRKHEIKAKLDEIIAFAGVERYIDTPVKRYSSGMYVRLAFAVAAHLEPDIMIVDEVLAVGDAEFQKKALGKMKDVSSKDGRTVLFVSHNMGAISSLCDKVLLLKHGKLCSIGPTREVIEQYVTEKGNSSELVHELAELSRNESYGNKLKINRVEWISGLPLKHGEPFSVRIYVHILNNVTEISMGIGFSTVTGTRLLTYETDFQDGFRPSFKAGTSLYIDLKIRELNLSPGIYSVDVGSRSGDSFGLDYLPGFCNCEIAIGKNTPGYIVRQDSGVRLNSEWEWHY